MSKPSMSWHMTMRCNVSVTESRRRGKRTRWHFAEHSLIFDRFVSRIMRHLSLPARIFEMMPILLKIGLVHSGDICADTQLNQHIRVRHTFASVSSYLRQEASMAHS